MKEGTPWRGDSGKKTRISPNVVVTAASAVTEGRGSNNGNPANCSSLPVVYTLDRKREDDAVGKLREIEDQVSRGFQALTNVQNSTLV